MDGPNSTDVPTRHSLVEELAEEMVQRWQAGERPVAEEYLDRFPELWKQPQASLELIAEELALRAEHGQPATAAELTGRFPQWQGHVLALLECQIALGQVRPRFPCVGEAIGEFELRGELGRGGEGRVFLAEQPLLAGRLVVLKLSPLGSCEHLCLARLQHSHIVPLYSAHEFPERGLLGLCMPYFGGTTLATVFNTDKPLTHGQALLDAMPTIPPAHPAPGSAWDVLSQATWPQTVCWLGACLAEALAYAHERDLVHLDVKPSNVLLAGDGTPMLLDFHLAHPPVPVGVKAPEWLGGTPGFMAPEQQAAFEAVQSGRTLTQPLDGRSDVYALGLVLKKLLQVSTTTDQHGLMGLRDILERCTQANAADRYTADRLAHDLRRHLADLPLQGVRNRSWAERWAKWRRRRPHVLPLAMSFLALFLAAIGLGIRSYRQVQQAEQYLAEGRAHVTAERHAEAVHAFRYGESLLDWLPWSAGLREQLRQGRIHAERLEVAMQLHRVVERVRPLYGMPLSPAQATAAASACRSVWDQRERLQHDEPPNNHADLAELAVLMAHLECLAQRSTLVAHREAIQTLADAERVLGPSPIIDAERDAHRQALGLPARSTNPPTHPRAFLAQARRGLVTAKLAEALAMAQRYLQHEPTFVGYYIRGCCLLALERPTEAIADFSAALALAPQQAWCIYNRGLAYLKANQLAAARADFDQALVWDATLVQAHVGRATVERLRRQFRQAHEELDQAAKRGYSSALIAYERALLFVAENQKADAVRSVQECIAQRPDYQPARELLARLQMP